MLGTAIENPYFPLTNRLSASVPSIRPCPRAFPGMSTSNFDNGNFVSDGHVANSGFSSIHVDVHSEPQISAMVWYGTKSRVCTVAFGLSFMGIAADGVESYDFSNADSQIGLAKWFAKQKSLDLSSFGSVWAAHYVARNGTASAVVCDKNRFADNDPCAQTPMVQEMLK